MAQESGRTRYHNGFYAAMKVEYDLIHAEVKYEQEIQLGEDPVRLDFLIIKAEGELKDAIGEYFRKVNLFEYKSPEDGLSIDDFYKAQGYALIYKGYDRKVNELPIEEITLTFVRHVYPRELMKELKKSGYEIRETHRGIYRVEGRMMIPVQIVVSSRLAEGEYEGLRLLAKGCTKEAVLKYAERVIASKDEHVKTNAGTVIEICLSINKELDRQIKEDEAMHKTIREIFKEDFEDARNEEKERVATDMLREGEPLEKIARYSRLAEDTIRNLAKTLGVAVL
ncbi:MAG: hypothetical protein IJQ08_10060 [Synergistaceae bacterium]|nr:hypothetical protein [Synergistaceae bacterium]